ncbi:MAG: aromatic amino acid lyase [Saprospiraceae bacterium]|nr:aromatic amino acid lyase [Candidatus Vicinibacter affinis]
MEEKVIGDVELSIEEIIDIVLNNKCQIKLSDQAWNRVRRSSNFFDDIEVSGVPVYGVNRSFGDLVDFKVTSSHHSAMQNRLLLSHSVGIGEIFDIKISKLIFFLRINCFANGASGIKEKTLEKLINIYNKRVVPEVSSRGSLGASGDLSPLAHFASFFIGYGYGYINGERKSAKVILKELGIKEIDLQRKEGLSLVNGTAAMTAVGIYVYKEFNALLDFFFLGMALMMDSYKFSTSFLQTEAFNLKAHKGSMIVVNKLAKYLKVNGSNDTDKLQAVYSIRCVPFILSPVVESVEYLKSILDIESNSVNDNPIYLQNSESIYHGGHFHGAPVAFALDNLRLAISILSNLIDRQLDHILDSRKNPHSISPFLSYKPEEGYTGFAGAQYLLTSLTIENKHDSSSYSNLSMPTNGGNQDLVSLGLQSGLSALKMLERLKIIIYIYYLSAIQSYSLSAAKPTTQILQEIYEKFNVIIKFPYKEEEQFSEILSKIMNSKVLEEYFKEKI